MFADGVWFVAAAISLTALMFLRFMYGKSFEHVDTNGVVGPSYWGIYQDSAPGDSAAEMAIHLVKPCQPIHTSQGERYRDQ